MKSISWDRVAAPQKDGYDTQVTLEFAAKSYGYAGKTLEEPLWLDGSINLRPLGRSLSVDLVNAPLDHPNLEVASKLLDSWPVVRQQVSELVDTVYPLDDERYKGITTVQGCCCGQESEFGHIYSTVMDPVGFAEGIVHEMGHWRIHALGIHLEDWDGLLLSNKPDELFPSPIRKDKLRPIGAVLHGQYSYVYVTGLNIQIVKQSKAQGSTLGMAHLAINLPRITEGLGTLKDSARTTKAGTAFLKGFYEWTSSVISEGNALLNDS